LQEGVEIELPDFDELFKRIQLASPLAKVAIEQAAKPDNGRSHFQSLPERKCLSVSCVVYRFAGVFSLGSVAEVGRGIKTPYVTSFGW
jgi:hypothetical protein